MRRGARIRLSGICGSEDFRRLNAGVLGTGAETREVKAAVADAGKARKSMMEETFAPKMNKSEAEVLRMLQSRYPNAFIVPQPTRFFRLKGGGTYTPDFLVFAPNDCNVYVVEVKGGYRGPGAEQGFDRYKRAALEFHGRIFRFEMFRRERVGKWEFQPWEWENGKGES